jgi:hypothetical protein
MKAPEVSKRAESNITVNLMDLFTPGVWIIASDRLVNDNGWNFKFSKPVLDGLNIAKLNGKLTDRYRIDNAGTAYFEYSLPDSEEIKV